MIRWFHGRSRPRWLARIVLLAFALLLVLPFILVKPAADRVTLAGQPFFLAGVNYPWKTGQDFGTGAWGHSGVSNPTTYAEVDTDFANMQAQGIRIVKWRIFGDGRYSPEFDANGYPIGFDNYFFRDLDAAIEIAHRHNIYLVFALFDSGFWTTSCDSNGVQLGGHADVLVDPAKRQAMIDRVIIPFLQHIGRNPQVLAFEVLTEPDWGVQELHTENDGRYKISLAQVRALVRPIVGAIHTRTNALATLEANRSRDMVAWRGLGLDYYSFSWYDWLEPWDPLNTAAWSFGLDRPVVIGEFPAHSAIHNLTAVLNIALNRGYAGAFAWSFSGVDESGSLTDERSTFIGWLQQHWPLVNLLAPKPPLNNPALQPPPYALNNVQVQAVQTGLSVSADLFLRDRQQLSASIYATPVGKTQSVAEVKVTAKPNARGQAQVQVAMTSLAENQPYKLSLGLFDADGHLLKWFDSIAYAEISHGVARTPDLPALARENPCHG